MTVRERCKKWWYRRPIRDGVIMIVSLAAVLLVIKAIIVCNPSGSCVATNSGCTNDLMHTALDLGIILLAATLGGLLGVDFHNHETEKGGK